MVANPLAPSWLHEPADANALEPGLWPAASRRSDDGALSIAGVSAQELAAQFGTPLYIIDEADVRARAADALAAFTDAVGRIGASAKVYYAGKAFLSTQIARWVSDAGLNIDVCSGGELAVVLAAGVDPQRLGFHGNNKSVAEIDRAVAVGVGAIVIDSEQEIARVAAAARKHGVVQRVRLRVNSGVHAHTHEFLATAHEDQKFGVPLDQAQRLGSAIRAESSLSFLGLHCHIGSQIFGSDGFAESAARVLDVHARLLADGPVPELNLGGGFGIAYTSVDEPLVLAQLASQIAGAVAASCDRLGIPVPTVAFEPGRAIVGPAGLTLYTVGTTKPVSVLIDGASADRLYVSVDGGMSDNARYVLYGADYSVRIANRTSDAAPALVRIAGKHCESGDIVVDADYLPSDVAPGDLLAVPATGAYCWSLSSNYNYLPRPAVVAVLDGHARIIVRGETEDDLLAHDVRLPALESSSTTKEQL
ncbi:diaminopimelate decarboxylase [Rathayibacter soli]|uniref:diaminopimelate decarboxylase n=1 Tax=Rathayibacter soli TaxID=3144168 RepID=UPI0027E3C8DF|nr:diaminopimelate decarboxylase [Glaciibacter superstes]